jgi:NADH-quinone oxidoreductase subunit F
MPAYAEEVDEAEKEGVRLEVLVAPVEVVTKDGKVVGLKCQKMALGAFDRTGRRRPEGMGGGEFVAECDQVIAAIGQILDPKEIQDGFGLRTTKSGFIEADPVTGQSSVPWVFAGGDAALGPSSVAEAVGSGEKAAVGIDKYLTGQEHAFWRTDSQVNTFFDPEAEPVEAPRQQIRLTPVKKRRHNFDEVELPWSEAVCIREAKRCLRCDYRDKETAQSRT